MQVFFKRVYSPLAVLKVFALKKAPFGRQNKKEHFRGKINKNEEDSSLSPQLRQCIFSRLKYLIAYG
jgi:hypothetical protein